MAGVPQVRLTVTDATTRLAATREPNNYARLDAVPTVLRNRGLGMPWEVNDFRTYPAFDPHAIDPESTLLDVVLRARDTERGYAWVDRFGGLRMRTPAYAPTTPTTLPDTAYNGELVIAYDSSRVLNRVGITVRQGTAEPVEHGPYVNWPSADRYGEQSAAYVLVSSGTLTPASWAQAVLAANAQPAASVDSVVVPLNTPAQLDAWADTDLYDFLNVSATDPAI